MLFCLGATVMIICRPLTCRTMSGATLSLCGPTSRRQIGGANVARREQQIECILGARTTRILTVPTPCSRADQQRATKVTEVASVVTRVASVVTGGSLCHDGPTDAHLCGAVDDADIDQRLPPHEGK